MSIIRTKMFCPLCGKALCRTRMQKEVPSPGTPEYDRLLETFDRYYRQSAETFRELLSRTA